VDRPTILARLASGGIDASAVRFTGSEKIIVCRDEKIVPAEEILKAAEALLQEKRPGPPGCSWKLARAVEDLAVPMSRGVRLRADLAKDTPASGPAAAVLERVKVEVQALSGTAELARCEAVFKVLYPAQQAVATKDIAPGAALTQENIRIEAVTTEAKPAEGWTAPFGLIAVKAVPAGAVVRPAFVQPPRPVILVKRNQSVTMRIIGSGFVVTALGEAMEDGRGGDVIKVRNADTRRVVVARVNFDGSVEPVMGESGR
jgi:flagella basal body P-ring formation protein FlgA